VQAGETARAPTVMLGRVRANKILRANKREGDKASWSQEEKEQAEEAALLPVILVSARAPPAL
jgi:hypothetical protein